MRITEELRKWMSEHYVLVGGMTDLISIADRIDAEHQKALDEQFKALTTDMEPMTDENMAKNGLVRLPKDADGEYVHIGDVMYDCGESPNRNFSVVTVELWTWGWSLIDNYGERKEPSQCRHYHGPTVEDVLSEMMRDAACQFYDDGSCRMGLTDEQFNKYAQRLQLSEES